MRVDDGEGLVEALKLGMGVCQLPDMMVQGELERGELVELLPSCRPEPMPIHIVYPSGRLVPERVRVAIEALDALRHRQATAAASG
jgi:LysR family transcriptional regulator, regulator for bpeEF and oprC